MNREIEEVKKLAETLRLIDELQFDPNYTLSYQRAMCLNNAGYRKSTDVAREIFAEIDALFDKYPTIRTLGGKTFAELRKKYESEGADDGT